MAAMNLLMADGAVLKPRRSQVVEGRRCDTGGCPGTDRCRQIRMTFETNLLRDGSRQHARIRRAMRLMTAGATLKPHRRMFKRERPALIAMACKASGFIRAEAPGHRG